MVEGAPLLRAYGSKAHRGFESLPLRHRIDSGSSLSVVQSCDRGDTDSLRVGFVYRCGNIRDPDALAHDLQTIFAIGLEVIERTGAVLRSNRQLRP